MKIVFMGTPHFASICLEKLIDSKHEILAVVCATDKPSGRGNKLTMPETKILALKHNIKVLQYEKIRVEGVEDLKSLGADIFVTASFGQILSQEIIDIPKYGIINVHGSLLPKYRGASPIQTAILNGDKTTGVTIMKTDAGVDTGDILLQKEFEIDEEDNTETLMNKCANIGAELLLEALALVESGNAKFVKQDENLATKTKMLKKENAVINFCDSAENIKNKIRAYSPDMPCSFDYNGNQFKVYKAQSVSLDTEQKKCGEVVFADSKKGLVIACKDSFLQILEIKPTNGKLMSAKAYLNGKKIEVGTVL